MKVWAFKGNRIRASDKSLVYHFCIGWLSLLFVAVFLLLNLRQLLDTDWKDFNLLHAGITWTASVWLPKTVAELLVQYQKDQKELQEFLGDAYNNYNLVIALENGNPVESRIVRDRFQKLCEQNGYEKVVFHSLRHLSTGYKLKMTNGDVKSVQGDTGHAEAEMVTDVYSEIIDEDRRYNAQKMDEQFYSTLNHDSEMQPQNEEVQPENNGLSDSDMELLQLLKSLTPEMKAMLLKQSASK